MTLRQPYLTPVNKPFREVATSSSLNLPLNTVVAPLPFRWQFLTPSTRIRVSSSDASYRWVNTTVVIPNRPPDLSYSRFREYTPPTQFPNLVVTTTPEVVAPFYNKDFSETFVPVKAKQDQQSLNLNLFTNPIPFAQYDWSKTEQLKTIVPDQSNLPNIVLLTPEVVVAPFYPVDFSTPFTPVPAKPDQRALNLNLYTNPIPFGPYDYSPRFVNRFTPADQNGVPNLVLENFSTPFVSYNWSKPTDVKASVDPQYPNLIILQPVGDPFNQLDWSKAYTIPPKSSNQNDLPNLLLIQPSTPSNPLGVYGWIDWSRTQKPVIIVPDQNNLPNIVLPNTIPVPPEIIVASGRWIKGVEALRAKAAEQTRSNDRAIKQAAAVLSKMGGIARAQALTATQRTKIATNAAKARWK